MDIVSPFSYPLYVMAKPAGASCNLACEYCYYSEKTGRHNGGEKSALMSDETLELYIKQYMESQSLDCVQFVWHGGEPTLRGIDFYRRAMSLQRKYARGRSVQNCLQTNGTLLTDEWCGFLKENSWLVGLSIDGAEKYHDEYRRDKQDRPTWSRVMEGIRLLQRHGVEWNAMAVVNEYNADYPREFYRFFKDIGCQYIQFTPVVERIKATGVLADGYDPEGKVMSFTVSPRQWGDFLIGVFDEWIREDVGSIFIQIFEATLANWMGVEAGICTLAARCGHAAVMEHNGDVYCCDHFVFPAYRLGNIHERTIIEMMASERQQRFGMMKETALPRQCRECEYVFACHGECPRNRFAISSDGEKGLNYLCEGYRRFFAHVAPYMDYMKKELDAGRAPANVMHAWRTDQSLSKS